MICTSKTPVTYDIAARCVAVAAYALVLQLLAPPVTRGDDLTMAEFRDLHQQLQVSTNAQWRTIPWKTSVLDAQRSAAQEAKPIFIWAMDGHPLGCT